MEKAKIPEKKPFIEREWTEDIEGKLDEDGFFVTPNGSFWDQDYVYFNREGFDRHGGRYDENGEYIPGEGWDDNLNCYESEKEEYNNEKDEDNELDEGYTEDAMMKELAQFNDDDDLFEGKDLIKEDPNIEKVIKHENEKDDFMDENIEDNKNIADDLEEREDDEYEEIEDEEKEKEDKKEENKNKKEEKNIINIEKGKKVFFIKTESGKSFTINGDDNNDEKKDKSLDNNNNAQKYDKNGIEYEINYSNNNYDKKYKDKFYYKNKNKSNKNNFHKKVYKNYNFFDDDKNK